MMEKKNQEQNYLSAQHYRITWIPVLKDNATVLTSVEFISGLES